jgi:hypothetical protein
VRWCIRQCGEEYHEAFSECSTYAEYLKESQYDGLSLARPLPLTNVVSVCRRHPADSRVHTANSLSAAVAFHEWARTQDLRFCPSCHELIEKNEGCDHMYAVLAASRSLSLSLPYHDRTSTTRERLQRSCVQQVLHEMQHRLQLV